MILTRRKDDRESPLGLDHEKPSARLNPVTCGELAMSQLNLETSR